MEQNRKQEQQVDLQAGEEMVKKRSRFALPRAVVLT
jgi:hypothetical protein